MQIQEQIDNRSGKPQLKSNIQTVSLISSYLRTSLGPFGLDKLFKTDNFLISNDGYTILKNLDFQNPIYKLLVDILEGQDILIGDGTTSVLLLVDCILRSLLDYLMRQTSIEAVFDDLEAAENKILDILKHFSINFELLDESLELKNTIDLKIDSTSNNDYILDGDSGIDSFSVENRTKKPIHAETNIKKDHDVESIQDEKSIEIETENSGEQNTLKDKTISKTERIVGNSHLSNSHNLNHQLSEKSVVEKGIDSKPHNDRDLVLSSDEIHKERYSRQTLNDIKSKLLMNLAKTPLNSKILKQNAEYFAMIVIKALKLDNQSNKELISKKVQEKKTNFTLENNLNSIELQSDNHQKENSDLKDDMGPASESEILNTQFSNFIDIQPIILKVPGGSAIDSFFFNGICFQKTFSYAGFEQQPKYLNRAKIVLTNEELEWKSERDNAEMLVNVEEYEKSVDAEFAIIRQKLDFCIQSGASVVLSSKAIGDYATQYFAKHEVFCAGRVDKDLLVSIQKTCGGRILNSLSGEQNMSSKLDNSLKCTYSQEKVGDDTLKSEDCPYTSHNSFLADCKFFEEKQLGTNRYNFIAHDNASSIILRGCGNDILNEMERSIIDSLSIIKKNLSSQIVTGGGSFEMNVSENLSRSKNHVHNLIASAFDDFLGILLKNMNKDQVTVLNTWKKNIRFNCFLGVSNTNENLKDMLIEGIIEPYSVKENVIKGAFNAVRAILAIESTLIVKENQK